MQNIYTSIEITGNVCKIAQGRFAKGALTLTKLVSVSLCQPDEVEEDVAAETKGRRLKSFLSKHRISPRNVILLAPKNFVRVRTARLPSADEDELKQMARFEAERHIPYNVENHVIGSWVLKKDHIAGSLVIVAAVDSALLQPSIDILSAAGLSISHVTLSSFALFNVTKHIYSSKLDEKPCIIVNIDLYATDIAVVHNGLVTFTRSVSQGVEDLLRETDLTDGDLKSVVARASEIDTLEPIKSFGEGNEEMVQHVYDWLGKLVKEIRRTHEFACREFECPEIETVFLSGTGVFLSNISRYLEVNLGVPIISKNPLKSIACSEGVVQESQGMSYCYSMVIGGILPLVEPGLVDVNLLPGEYMAQRSKEKRKRTLTVTGVLFGIALLMGIGWMKQTSMMRSNLVSFYEVDLGAVSDDVNEIKDKSEKLSLIENHLEDKYSALGILNEISSHKSLIPEKVTLTSFEFKRNESITLNGHARTYKDLMAFETMLTETGFFDEVRRKPGAASKDFRGRGKVVYYTITCMIKEE